MSGRTCPDCGNRVPEGFSCFYGCDDWRRMDADREAAPDRDVEELLNAIGLVVVDGKVEMTTKPEERP